MAIERQVEIEPRLLAVRHDVQTRGHLIVHGGHDRVVLQLGAIVGTELGPDARRRTRASREMDNCR